MYADSADTGYAVALSCCAAALHLCVKLAGEWLYGRPAVERWAVDGKRVFCSDMIFAAWLNLGFYEGYMSVFIDTEYDTWDMDPAALRKGSSWSNRRGIRSMVT